MQRLSASKAAPIMAPKVAPNVAPAMAPNSATPANDQVCNTFRKKFLASKLNEKMKTMDSKKKLSQGVLFKMLATSGLKPTEQMIIMEELGLKRKESIITCGNFLEWCNTF